METKKGFNRIIYFSIMCGGLCGYILGVISGVLAVYEKELHFTDSEVSIVAGAILLGCFFASICTGAFNDILGRKKVMILTYFLFLVGTLGMMFSGTFKLVYLSRLIQGLGFGMAVIVLPVYLSEISSKFSRGRIITTFQLSLTGGVLVSNIINMILIPVMGCMAILVFSFVFACFVFIMIFILPESPRWLHSIGKHEKAKESLALLGSRFRNYIDWNEIDVPASGEKIGVFKTLFDRRNIFPIFVCTAAVSLNQLSGINSFLQCSVTILKTSGISSELVGLVGGVFITSINFLATVMTLIFVERIGRRKILKIGTTGLLIVLLALSAINAFLPNGELKGYVTMIGIVLVVGFFAFGPGGVILVLCSELLPNKIRSIGFTISFTVGALVGMIFVSGFIPLSKIIGYSGLFFMIACFVFCYVIISFIIPETKGKSLEEIELEYNKKK
ncbi:MAG: MFS transporter [Lentisphaerota bacterium]